MKKTPIFLSLLLIFFASFCIFFVMPFLSQLENLNIDNQIAVNTDTHSDFKNITYMSENKGNYKEKEYSIDTYKHYYYNLLSSQEAEFYDRIVNALKERQELELTEEERQMDIEKIYNYVCLDHPEIYYIDGYLIESNEYQNKEIFKGDYYITEEEVQSIEMHLNHYYLACKKNILDSDTDYTKTQKVYEYLIKNTVYDINAPYNQSIVSVAQYGASVCAGYSKMFQYIMNKLNVPTIVVTGNIKDETQTPHMWNASFVDGQWCFVDCTYGEMIQNEYVDINYDYLCINEAILAKTHTINNRDELPDCYSDNNNFYTLNGYLVNVYREKEINEILLKQNTNKIYIKFKNSSDFKKFKHDYIDEEEIFRVIDIKTFVLLENEIQNTICIII